MKDMEALCSSGRAEHMEARRLSKQIGYVHFSHILSYGYQGIEWHFIRNPAKGFFWKMNFKGLNLSFKSEKSDCLLFECTLLVHVG